MRFVVVGAGAVGGVIGGRLAQHGHEVVLVARDPHLSAIRSRGLRLDWPEGSVVLGVDAVESGADVSWRDDDVVLLCVKSQDTDVALAQVRASAHAGLPIICAQNGVESERRALRLFERVYGMCVMLPAEHLEPGIVRAYGTPNTGILDVGRYPLGSDDVTSEVSAALAASEFVSESREDIMRWKHAKLLMNLGNAVEAACGADARTSEVAASAYNEGVAVLEAAGLPFVSAEEDMARRGTLMTLRPIDGQRRDGGSTWQSLARGLGTVETDFLNGEIVILGRLHGVDTPVNAMLQQLLAEMSRSGAAPGSKDSDTLLALLGR